MLSFLSVDIETTGLNESYCQILEIGMVLGDLGEKPVADLPSLNLRLYYDRVIGDPYALHLNAKIIGEMEKRMNVIGAYRYVHPDSVWSEVICWLEANGVTEKITVAGKNYASFDRRFLVRLPRWNVERFHHRTIDPGNLFWQPADDSVLPDTKECIRRAGLQWDAKFLHSALWDARLVVELVRAGARRIACT